LQTPQGIKIIDKNHVITTKTAGQDGGERVHNNFTDKKEKNFFPRALSGNYDELISENPQDIVAKEVFYNKI